MIAEDKKSTECEMESPLDEALKLSGEVVALRSRFVAAQREHAALLAQRVGALSEGIDLLPEIRVKYLEIEKLPSEIAQLQQRVNWLVDQAVAKSNAENRQIAGQEYMKNRDALRKALEQFRDALASVLQEVEASINLGPSLTDVSNTKLGEIEKLLGGVHFSRVEFRLLPLPPLDSELVRRNQVLAALDRWIGGLH
jgi:chromosome segregation ATPase